DFIKKPAAVAQIENIKQQGKVIKVGLSLYSPKQINEKVLNFADLIQLPANIFDQRFKQSLALNTLKNADIEIHTRSAFLQGLLLMAE
ncbi:hypothetical protein VST04_27895, partial [Bacillus paranthracis]|nr:hypothetical protein [Bacillus paranthracis]